MLGWQRRATFVFCVLLASCASDDGPDGRVSERPVPTGPFLDGDCDPLVEAACALPFPSDAFTEKDDSTETGKRVAFGQSSLPGITLPDAFRYSDGFSPGAGLMAHFPGATTAGLPTPLTIAASLEPDSPTVVIEADTGERVPHFSELDMSHGDDARRAFIVRPVVRLKPKTRYVVAIRSVVDGSGAPVAASSAFQALRDGTAHEERSVELRRELYADIFARLAAAGVERDTLQLAWDFTVASDENNTRWMLSMRDQALQAVGADGPEYVLDSVQVDPEAHIAVRIEGRMTVPLFLDQPGPGGRLSLDDGGLPLQQGSAEYPFLVIVPKSAETTPAAPLQIGHGLLGSRSQAAGFATFANERSYLLVATDLVGMASDDVPHIASIILGGDIGQFKTVADRLQQGLLNALLAMRMTTGRLARDPALTFNGRSAVDPDERYYLGGSQGGIFGASYVALSTDVTRGILGVPGQPYNLLLNRSVDFDPYLEVMRTTFSDPIDLQIVLALAQMLWDRAEPTGYSHRIEQPLPGTPAHRVLLQVAIGDHQVTTLGAHLMARAIGAKSMEPAPRPIFGLERAQAPYEGSAIVEYDFGLPPEPLTNVPMREGTDPHGQVKNVPASADQVDTFLRSGVVQWFCDGACDPD